jgi:hypothetical protein
MHASHPELGPNPADAGNEGCLDPLRNSLFWNILPTTHPESIIWQQKRPIVPGNSHGINILQDSIRKISLRGAARPADTSSDSRTFYVQALWNEDFSGIKMIPRVQAL